MNRGAQASCAHVYARTRAAQRRVPSLLRQEVRTTWVGGGGPAGGGMACRCVRVRNLPPSLGRFDSAGPPTSLMSVYYS